MLDGLHEELVAASKQETDSEGKGVVIIIGVVYFKPISWFQAGLELVPSWFGAGSELVWGWFRLGLGRWFRAGLRAGLELVPTIFTKTAGLSLTIA